MMDAFNSEAITVGSTAVGPTSATAGTFGTPTAATECYVTVETAGLRYRYGGADPTSTVGHEALPGEAFRIRGAENVASLKMIRTTSTSAAVFITYER